MTRTQVTRVLAPVAGRAVPLDGVPDPVFSQGMLGYGAAIDPPREVLVAAAPVAGRVVRLMPHAYVVMTTGGLGVLVHLGLDTATLGGEGFTTHVEQGEDVAAGQPIVTYDAARVDATGLNPIVPVVVLDERNPGNVEAVEAVSAGADIAMGTTLFTTTKAR